MSGKGLVRTINNLDLMIYASGYYLFQTNMKTRVIKHWQDKEIWQDMILSFLR